jgi:hypothetical protein
LNAAIRLPDEDGRRVTRDLPLMQYAGDRRSATFVPGPRSLDTGRRSPIRHASPIAAAIALFAATPAQADTQIAEVERPAPISAHGGRLAWSTYDAASGAYRLTTWIDGRISNVPVSPRKAPFDVDLGPGREGDVVAAYSRCRSEHPHGPARSRGCDIYRYSFATGREEKLAGVSTHQASEFLPSIWRDKVAFARVYEQRDGRRGTLPHLYVRRLTTARSATSERQPGGSRGRRGLPGPVALDLYGRRLSFVWEYVPQDAGAVRYRSELRLDTVDSGHRVVDRIGSGGASSNRMLAPTGADGRLYFGTSSIGAQRNRFKRYRISTGRLAEIGSPSNLHALTWMQDRFAYVQSPGYMGAGCDADTPSGDDGCRIALTGPSVFGSRDENAPVLLSAEYGKARPKGAERSFYALTVRARDADGQFIAMEYAQIAPAGGPIGHADGACGLGGKRNGEVETWTLPIRRLEPGTYRFRITATSSTCDAGAQRQRTMREFTVRVR